MQFGTAPSKHAAHRLACLALYRALLQQCSKLTRVIRGDNPIDRSHITSLGSLVRHRFEVDRRYKNRQQIQNALTFGRQALELLEDATASTPRALETITRILTASTTLALRKREVLNHLSNERGQQHLPRKFTERKAREVSLADPSSYQRRPETVPVLERPVPYEQALKHKDGRRRVPNYFVAQGVPFLRYTHEQPLSLSRYMSQQLKKHEKLWKNASEGQEKVVMAELEDDWDVQLWKDHKLSPKDLTYNQEHGTKWADSCQGAWKDNQAKISKLDTKRLEYGQRLWKIFLKEEDLARTENRLRKEKTRRTWKEKQAEECA